MTLQIIGAGLGRTGTHSLAIALEKLGFGPCYHLLEIDKNAGHLQLWNEALKGKPINWSSLFQAYNSVVEWPAVSFLPQLLKTYPDAKFILTQRDAEAWYESAHVTIFEGLELSQHNPDPSKRASADFKRRLILEGTFSGKYRDKAHTIAIYKQHIRDVIALIPAEQLLHFDVKEGWQPLCDFLGASVPDEPFPIRNQRNKHLAQMPDWARKIKDQQHK